MMMPGLILFTRAPRLPQRTALAITSDIIEAILHGRQPADMTLTVLMRPFAVAWTEQRQSNFCCTGRRT